jgi:hypothetical protein
MITGPYQWIEFKGLEPIPVRNYLRLLVTGNPNWLVPAGLRARRFSVLDVGDEHLKDAAYFAAIDKEMDNGGREALLYYLLNFDLSKVNLREILTTSALLDQKIASLQPEHAWWFDLLQRGQLPGASEQANVCARDALFDDYVEHARKSRARGAGRSRPRSAACCENWRHASSACSSRQLLR